MTATHSKQPTLMSLAWPIFIEQGLRVLISTVDTFMVSHIGDDAVSGLSVAGQVIVLFIILFNFVAIGSSVVITHHLGAKDRAGADKISVTAIAANTWLGVAASILVGVLAAPAMKLMNLPEGPASYALPFLGLMGGTLFLESMNISIGAVLRAHTFTRDAMLVSVGQNIINAAGVCVTLFGLLGCPKLGVVGVALASIFSRLCACVALWVILRKRTQLRFNWRDYFQIKWESLKRILHIGIPAAGENISWFLGYMTVTSFVATMGPASLATQSYTMNLVSWVILANASIGVATEIMIGHHVGAGDLEAAYKQLLRSLRMGLIISVGMAALFALLGPLLLGMFTSDAAVIAGGAVLLRMGLLLEPGRVFNIVVINSLRATGDARFPVLIGMMSMWGLWIPLAWLLGLHLGWGMPGIWCAMICDEWLRGMLMLRRWRQRKWMDHARASRASVAAGKTDASATTAEAQQAQTTALDAPL